MPLYGANKSQAEKSSHPAKISDAHPDAYPDTRQYIFLC